MIRWKLVPRAACNVVIYAIAALALIFILLTLDRL